MLRSIFRIMDAIHFEFDSFFRINCHFMFKPVFNYIAFYLHIAFTVFIIIQIRSVYKELHADRETGC